MSNNVFINIIIGAFGGGLYYTSESICSGGMNGIILFKCIVAGALVSFIFSTLREIARHYIPLFQSWLMIIIILFTIPYMLNTSGIEYYWTAALYGYLSHLLWEAYKHRLPKI